MCDGSKELLFIESHYRSIINEGVIMNFQLSYSTNESITMHHYNKNIKHVMEHGDRMFKNTHRNELRKKIAKHKKIRETDLRHGTSTTRTKNYVNDFFSSFRDVGRQPPRPSLRSFKKIKLR